MNVTNIGIGPPGPASITCAANEAMAEVHDRMPVMLPPSAWDRWLDPAETDGKAAAALLVPAPSSLIRMHPVSTEVNNVRNNGPHLIAEAQPARDDNGRQLIAEAQPARD